MLIEHEWHSYNTRRYGNPWVARITWNGVKPVFDFVGRFASGQLAFEAEPGEIVAMGQKDHRGNGTTKEFYVLGEDGSLTGLSEAEARTLWRERQAVTTATTTDNEPATPDNGADNDELERLRADNARLVAVLKKAHDEIHHPGAARYRGEDIVAMIRDALAAAR